MIRPCTSAAINHQMRTYLVPQKLFFNILRTHSRDKSKDYFKSIGSAKEAQFFKKREKELLTNLKEEMKEQISFHEEQINIHKAVIEKLKKKQKDMEEN